MKRLKNNRIQAKEGKTFRRISDGFIAGNTLCLGKTYYLAGKLLDEPIDELPEHYEEVDQVVIDEERPLVASPDEVTAEIPVETTEIMQEEAAPEQEDVIPKKEPVTITVQDIISMQEKIDKIIGVLTSAQKKKLGII
jgi:hypothetical protein